VCVRARVCVCVSLATTFAQKGTEKAAIFRGIFSQDTQ
jgi:hypothetical protein